MTFVYLGFLEMLEKAVEGIIGPLVKLVFETVVGFVMSTIGMILKNVMYTIWLQMFRVLLKAIYFMVRVFDVLSGMSSVAVIEDGRVVTNTSLIQYLFNASAISKMFLMMTIAAMALAFLFAIYETGKTISDSALEDEAKPISKVLTNALRTALTFMLVPFMCVACLQLSSVLCREISVTFNSVQTEQHARTEFSDILFEMAAEPALKIDKNSSAYYEKFWKYDQPYQNPKLLEAEDVYDLKEIDYFIGIPSALILLVILIGAGLAFVRRIIDVLVLYLISPYFAATISLDGGQRFKKWRDTFVGAFFGCFGSVFAMRIYLILIPIITDPKFTFSKVQQVNYLARILFVIGSSWAIYKSTDMITELIAPNAGKGANESMALIGGGSFAIGKSIGGKLLGR